MPAQEEPPMSAIHTVLAARALLETLTPLKTDCGRLCGGACCRADDTTGMLLFPDEDTLYADCAFARVIPASFSLGRDSAKLLICSGVCDRKNRPLACRLFPLFLVFKEDGSTKMRLDARARAVCPLTGYGVRALDPAFRQAARQAYDLLLADACCAEYLRALHEAFSL